MNKDILHTGVQHFIVENLNTDIVSVLLKKVTFDGVGTKELVQQIEAKKKCESKLPTWFKTTGIYYPDKLNIEQTSSETTAQYKANLVHGNSMIDLTGGLGVDCYFFSTKMEQVVHCEIDKNLSEIADYNYGILGVKNIRCLPENGLDYLEDSTQKFDWIYVDPSRRNDAKGKVFMLSDCLPDVPNNLSLLFKKTSNILIKTSPLLDFTIGINELQSVKEIHVVAIKNEVKELLWILEKDYLGEISIKTINFNIGRAEKFDFGWGDEKRSISQFGLPQTYLYEPNSAILKSGAFKTIGNTFGLKKLQEHSHLYTADKLVDFPGRTFNIQMIIPYNKKAIQKLGIQKANVTTRNFPESVESFRKKHKIKDGGNDYLFLTTNYLNEKTILICKKIT
ncbi:class I SAM-dependent methyltransferase [Flavobacteriaceae bacterium KMM 6897]|nr:class I SAM-dependent methyltransferase [Flavobacteriaceae bacterium KMM 6897]MEB8347197.1 class I SAM-dependent methyltransferase [Flavobacteriaceae bacterium KMM 6898]